MPPYDVITMWGPPGTGKTAVLTSIIAMALKTNKTVHVCAPSNAAIDEILNRINAKGLVGFSN
jgi:ATP-dependent RNA/DNA helicase IGHMBP2